MKQLRVTPTHASCVSRVPIFAALTPEQQDAVAAYARPRELAPGEVLHGVGARLGQLFVVHRGSLKTLRVNAAGHEQLIRVAGPGDVVGEHTFLTGERPDYLVVAAEPSQMCVFEHARLADLIAAYPRVAIEMFSSLSHRLEAAERRIAALTATEVSVRLVDYLLNQPAQPTDGRFRIELPMSKRDIASYLGTTPESLSRALRKLQTQGLIEVGAGRRVDLIDPLALEALTP